MPEGIGYPGLDDLEGDPRKKLLQIYLSKLRGQQDPRHLARQRQMQAGREDLATLGRFATGMGEAAATMGGTKPSASMAAQAKMFEDRAAAGRPKPETGIGLDPRILKLLGKDKPKKTSFIERTDQWGVTRRVPLGDDDVPLTGDPREIITKFPNREKTRKSISEQYGKKMKYHEQLSRTFTDVRNLVAEAEKLDAAGGNTGGLDHAIIKRFEKMLDPTSVVREGEFQEARRIAGAVETIKGWWDRVTRGEKLTSAGRQAILAAVSEIYDSSVNSAVPFINQRYKKLVGDLAAQGLDLDFERDIRAQITPMAPKQKAQQQQPPGDADIPADIKAMSDEELRKKAGVE